MHQTVVHYVNEPASKTLTEIYTTISKAYSGRQGADLQRELNGVKQTLVETRRITAIEFRCFRKPKDKEREREKDKMSSSKTPQTDRDS